MDPPQYAQQQPQQMANDQEQRLFVSTQAAISNFNTLAQFIMDSRQNQEELRQFSKLLLPVFFNIYNKIQSYQCKSGYDAQFKQVLFHQSKSDLLQLAIAPYEDDEEIKKIVSDLQMANPTYPAVQMTEDLNRRLKTVSMSVDAIEKYFQFLKFNELRVIEKQVAIKTLNGDVIPFQLNQAPLKLVALDLIRFQKSEKEFSTILKSKIDYGRLKLYRLPNDPVIETTIKKISVPLPDMTKMNDYRKSIEPVLNEIKQKQAETGDASPNVGVITINTDKHKVTACCLSMDCTYVAVGFNDSLIKLWKKTDNAMTEVGSHSKHVGEVYALSIQYDNQFMVSGSSDSTIILWNLFEFTPIQVYKAHQFEVNDVKFAPLGHYFASGSSDQLAKLWSVDQLEPLRIFSGHLLDVTCVQFHPNMHYLATGGKDQILALWSIVTGEPVRILTIQPALTWSISFSNSGRFIVVGNDAGRLCVFDLNASTEMDHEAWPMPQSSYEAVYGLSFSPNDSQLAIADQFLKFYNFEKAATEDTERQPDPNQFVTSAQIQTTAIRLLQYSLDGSLWVVQIK